MDVSRFLSRLLSPPAKVCEPPLTVQILVQVAHFTSSSSGRKLRSAVLSQCMQHIHGTMHTHFAQGHQSLTFITP